MRSFWSFLYGILVGTVVGTAWASYTPTTPASVGDAAIAPMEMMMAAPSLPAQPPADMF